MKPLFISATGTDIGKSYVSRLIVQRFIAMGFESFLCKPLESGVDCALPSDSSGHLETLLHSYKARGEVREISPKSICFADFPLPAAPFVSAQKEEKTIDVIAMKQWIVNLAKEYSPLLIEGAGGLLVPILADYFMIDLAQDLGAHVLLVASPKLGGINDLLLSMEALQRRAIPYTPLLNIKADEIAYFEEISAPFWKQRGGILQLERDFEALVPALLAAIK